MQWYSPVYFLLFIPLVGILIYYFLFRKKFHATLQVSSVYLFKKAPKTWRSFFRQVPLILMSLSLVFAIIALARPRKADTSVRKNIEGIDIVIALDISDSMLIEDMKPLNRLEAAKETIKEFIKKRTSDRIGLVIFAGESFTLVPPTLDYNLILQRVNEIQTAAQANMKEGTAIGVALANAAGRLKDSTAKTRIVIFMTDGENNSGTIDPETAIEIAKGYGLKVYSIGLGRDGPTKLPVYQYNPFGQRIKTYQPFNSTVNEELLNKMANETQGKFFRAIREDSLAGVFKEIDSLEKTKVEVSNYTRYEEHFYNYLYLAVILFFMSWGLSSTILRRAP